MSGQRPAATKRHFEAAVLHGLVSVSTGAAASPLGAFLAAPQGAGGLAAGTQSTSAIAEAVG